jgi:CHAT domain-containing protein
MSRQRFCGIFVATALAAAARTWSASPPPAASCEPPARNILRELRLDLRDRTRSEQPLELPANSALMLLGNEAGIDSILEVRDAAGNTQSADNPMRRLGPQRIFLEARPTSWHVTVAGVGKEPARGSMKVQVVSLRGMPGECVVALRALAMGDQQFARAQVISMGDVEAGDQDLPQAYKAALSAYRAAAAALPRAETLRADALISTAGVLLLGTQSWAEALEASQVAEAEERALGQEYGRLRARSMWASALMEVAVGAGSGATDEAARAQSAAQLEQVRGMFREVAAAHVRRGEIYDQAIAQNNIGLAYYYEDAFALALPEYRVAQALQHGLGERMREAQALQNIGLTQLDLAQFSAARENLGRALALVDESTSPKLYADILNNLALMNARKGNFDDALRIYSQALAIQERVHSRREQARSLHGIANVYRAIGSRREALDYFRRAFERRSPTADFVGYLFSLNALADGLREDGRAAEAIAMRTDAMKKLKTDVQRARMLVPLASDQFEVGELDAARASLAGVIDAKGYGDRVLLARALVVRAKLAKAQRSVAAARADLDSALAVFREYQLATDEFEALLASARLACDAHNEAAATRDVDAALALAEQLRRASNNPTMRASLWEPLHPAFDLRIRLTLAPETCGSPAVAPSAERDRRALEIAERSRARALDEFRELSSRKSSLETGSNMEKRRQQIFEQLADRRQRIELGADNGRQDSARNAALRAEIVQLMRELDILDAGVKPLRARQREVGMAIRRSIEMIPADTAVIEYWLGETNAYAWLVTRAHIRVFDLGRTRQIDQITQKLSESMANFSEVPRESRIANARALHALVVAPMTDALKGIRTIYFVPDGALHQVSFAVLVSDAATRTPRFLIDDHDIAVGASITTAVPDSNQAKLTANAATLIVADPVYGRDDSRFADQAPAESRAKKKSELAQTLRGAGAEKFERLTGSAREADVVAALFDASSTERLSGFDATRDAILSRDLARYRVIHFATHSVADIEAPQLSTVVLSTYDAAGKQIPGELFAGDLLGRRLEADLVVLSGCDSSLGRQFMGEGLLGMRYAAHAAGARTVVASLWQVADVVGPQLMAGFYSRMTRAGQTPVAALSQVMREAKERRSDPALWGVFQVSHARRATTVN